MTNLLSTTVSSKIKKAPAVLETPRGVTQPSISRRVVEYYSTPYTNNSIGCLVTEAI